MADALYACLCVPAGEAGDGAAAALPAIAAEFSPRYEHRRGDGVERVVVDVSGLERLIGPPRAIGEELRRTAASRGVRVHVAVARTQTAARVLAHAQPGLTVSAPGAEAQMLAPLPIALLDTAALFDGLWRSAFGRRSDRTTDPPAPQPPVAVFRSWGLKTLGELAALPADQLAARLGRAGVAWQALARGDDVRPFVPDAAEERFEGAMDLEWPIDGLEPLSFVLTRLLEPLSTRLERRDRGAAVLHVLLRLVTRETFARRLELPAPMREVRALRTLALLDLESHPPGAAIDGVTVVLDPTPGRIVQHRLFARAHPTPEQLSTLLARLGALMGQDRIGAPVAVDTYRPGAFAMKPFPMESRGTDGARGADGARGTDGACGAGLQPCVDPDGNVPSALRRCRQPVPARVAVADGRPVRVTTDRRGFAGGRVLQCAGPWRTSGEWWLSESLKAERQKPESLKVERQKPESLKSEVRSQNSGENELQASDFRLQTSDFRLHTSDFRLQTSMEGWDRDEWDVSLADGAVYRVFRDRASDRWFIDAIVD
jgi:protein ImuB